MLLSGQLKIKWWSAIYLVVFTMLVNASPVHAQKDSRGPEEILRTTTAEMLTAIEAARHYYDKDAEQFYAEVDRILLPVVDFQGFARGVMGQFASMEAYKKLTAASDQQAYKDRIKRFEPKLRSTMVSSYSKGLLAVNTDAIEIVKVDEAGQKRIASGEAVQIVQLVKSSSEKPYVIKYLFKPGRNGEWKVRNLDVDGVDLGRVYRSQFSASVRDLGGDVDQAVDKWTYSELTEAGS